MQLLKLQLATSGAGATAFTASTWCHGFRAPHHHQASFLSWGRVARKHIPLVPSLRADSITRWPGGWWSASVLTLIFGMKLMTNISPNHAGFKNIRLKQSSASGCKLNFLLCQFCFGLCAWNCGRVIDPSLVSCLCSQL